MASLMVHHTQKQANSHQRLCFMSIAPLGTLVSPPPPPRLPSLGSSTQTGVCLSVRQQDVSYSSAFVMVDCSVTHTGMEWGGGGGVLHTHVLSNNPPPSVANLWIWQPGACAPCSASLSETKTRWKPTDKPKQRRAKHWPVAQQPEMCVPQCLVCACLC